MNVINTHIQVNALLLKSSQEFSCGEMSSDTCYDEERAKLDTSCTLPFEDIVDNSTICKTNDEGLQISRKLMNIMRRFNS